jgi:hypothetical protein
MIIIKLQGGLANQIFQWAYGEYLSEKYSTPLYLDLNFYKNQFGVTPRNFSLDKFPKLLYKILPYDGNISNWSNEKEKVKIVKIFDKHNYSEIEYQQDSHYYLDGYWQSEKYFKPIENIIREQLRPNADTINKLKEKYPTEKSISMHIRRTDYVSSNGFHPVQTIEYYQSGLEIIGEYDNLLIFSDDINWCKENLKFENMTFVEGNDDVEDIWLMSMCDHNIIANSSFSWWGAWLNENRDKKIIAPKKWFGDKSNTNYSDIIPDDWIKI